MATLFEVKPEYKKFVLLLDILMITALMMHFATIFFTNMTVAKQGDVVILESNTVARDNNPDYYEPPKEVSKELQKQWLSKVLYFGSLGLILTYYVFCRMRVRDKKELFRLAALSILWSLLMGYNFVNDFGYFVGSLLK